MTHATLNAIAQAMAVAQTLAAATQHDGAELDMAHIHGTARTIADLLGTVIDR